MRRKHLFLSLARHGLGEATMGLALANEMREAGDDVFFLVNENLAPLLSSARVAGETLQESLGPLVEVLIEDIIANEKPISIVLADHLVCGDAFQRMGVALEILSRFGLPVVAIDTWNHAETGTSVDLAGGASWLIPEWSKAVTHGLIPAPFNRPAIENACSFMPRESSISRRVRGHVRTDLGLTQHDRLAILCTSEWQSMPVGTRAGARVADTVPVLLAKYFEVLGRSFHLLHCAPRPFEALRRLGDRYHWLPSFPPLLPEQFQAVIGSADLVLSLNYSATTNNLALALGVPVLLVKNSCEASSLDEVVAWLGSSPGKTLGQWANGALPLPRFRLWPLGFHTFLEPAFHCNEFLDVCPEVELLREEEFLVTCERVASDGAWRTAFGDRCKSYLSRLADLPRPGALMRKLLEV